MVQIEHDQSLEPDDRLTVIQAIRQFRTEADNARRGRIARNKQNRDVFLGRQDWSHKQSGQSTEFLPKVPVAAEQMSAFVKRALTQFGEWYSVDVDERLAQLIDGAQIRAILDCFLQNLWAGNNRTTTMPTIISDAVKNGLLESLMILKVHGGMMSRREFRVEQGEVLLDEEMGTVTREQPSLATEEMDEWRLRIDLVRPEDYYPDPTGNGLYEIHRVERDLHEVVKLAEDGVYDEAMVQLMVDTDYTRPRDEERSDSDRAQQEATSPQFRKRVVLDEFWGTLLHADGTVAHRNVVATVANDKYLIREPEPNPFWHQESPFVVSPLVRVPWSVWHKALYDDACNLNLAMNEMFNLMLDGGLASVWGVKQVRLEDMEDPGQVAGGVQQGATIAVKGTLPHNAKVLETVSEGEIPRDAMAIFEFLNREFVASALTNEIKLGSLPAKEVRATEILEAQQSQAVTMDGLVSDLEEGFIKPLLRKAWLTVLQNADDIPPEVLMHQVDRRAAVAIMRASPAERFELFAGMCSFKVHGLSATMARVRDFQKIMALLQAVTTNPMLFQAFMMRFSPDKTLSTLMKTLNINPQDIEKSFEEMQQMAEEMQRTEAAAQMLGTNGQQGQGLQDTGGDPNTPAEVNQLANPMTGMSPGA